MKYMLLWLLGGIVLGLYEVYKEKKDKGYISLEQVFIHLMYGVFGIWILFSFIGFIYVLLRSPLNLP